MVPDTTGSPAAARRTVRGVDVPLLIYGTAWKEDRTASLVGNALRAGFRGIDTANQRRHYFEAAVGEAVQAAMRDGLVARDELFLQTKFTFRSGQDHRLPYDPKASISSQVEQSFASSLEHLGVDRLDAYLLHGPSTFPGLGDADAEAWKAMESLQRAGRVRLLGVSNVTRDQLQAFCDAASVPPSLVQNRTFTRYEADRDVRELCKAQGILYEGFSLLTAILPLLGHPELATHAARLRMTPAQVVLRHCLDRDVLLLTGTTSEEHMRQDLAVPALPLDADASRFLSGVLGP